MSNSHIQDATSIIFKTDDTIDAKITATTNKLTLSNNTGGSIAIYGVLNPTGDSYVANKAYVDSIANGLDVKVSVHVATTSSGTLASSFKKR